VIPLLCQSLTVFCGCVMLIHEDLAEIDQVADRAGMPAGMNNTLNQEVNKFL